MAAEPPRRNRILIVEDEVDLSSSMAYALRAHGYEAQIADRGESAMRALDDFHPDLVLLDLMLPDMSGLEVCRRLRSSSRADQPAVIIVSARAQEIDRVVGFEIGADDYVVKPFSVRELILRIEARLKSRRARSESPATGAVPAIAETEKSLALGILKVDESGHRVFVANDEVHVSALEMRVLAYLFHSPGRMRTRRELLTEVWGYHPEVSSRTVDTHIKRIRDKLGVAAGYLQTVRGVGFRLADPAASSSRQGDKEKKTASEPTPHASQGTAKGRRR
jgi:two-component system phosphate regulon response regulator PhoB